MFQFMKEYVSVHHPIIYTGLKYITPMLFSIGIEVHFFFGALMEFRGVEPAVQQWNRLLDAVVTIMTYKKSTVGNSIYIKLLSYVNVSYLTVSTDYFLNTTNN